LSSEIICVGWEWGVGSREEISLSCTEFVQKSNMSPIYIAVIDLVRYALKAINLDKQDLSVPQLLRKRHKLYKKVFCIVYCIIS